MIVEACSGVNCLATNACQLMRATNGGQRHELDRSGERNGCVARQRPDGTGSAVPPLQPSLGGYFPTESSERAEHRGHRATEDEARRASTEAKNTVGGAGPPLRRITGFGGCSPPVSWATVTLVKLHSPSERVLGSTWVCSRSLTRGLALVSKLRETFPTSRTHTVLSHLPGAFLNTHPSAPTLRCLVPTSRSWDFDSVEMLESSALVGRPWIIDQGGVTILGQEGVWRA
jgi:hypothetical protein